MKEKKQNSKTLRFIDLFAGIGGIRKGFELACRKRGIDTKCVFTSEIKPHARKVLLQNNPGETITGDITQVDEKNDTRFRFSPCELSVSSLFGGWPPTGF